MKADVHERPTLVFTDGAYELGDELGDATRGSVVIVPGKAVEEYGAKAPLELTERWKSHGK